MPDHCVKWQTTNTTTICECANTCWLPTRWQQVYRQGRKEEAVQSKVTWIVWQVCLTCTATPNRVEQGACREILQLLRFFPGHPKVIVYRPKVTVHKCAGIIRMQVLFKRGSYLSQQVHLYVQFDARNSLAPYKFQFNGNLWRARDSNPSLVGRPGQGFPVLLVLVWCHVMNCYEMKHWIMLLFFVICQEQIITNTYCSLGLDGHILLWHVCTNNLILQPWHHNS